MEELETDGAECSRKVARGRRVVGAIRSLVNARELMLWREKERCRVRAVQMDNLR